MTYAELADREDALNKRIRELQEAMKYTASVIDELRVELAAVKHDKAKLCFFISYPMCTAVEFRSLVKRAGDGKYYNEIVNQHGRVVAEEWLDELSVRVHNTDFIDELHAAAAYISYTRKLAFKEP